MMEAPIIEWGVATQAYPGQSRSGDSHIVVLAGERAMIGVIDGIGHGDAAADAASAAVDVIKRHATEPVDRLFNRCHDRLTETRGAAMTLACFDGVQNRLTWMGAGNVMAALVGGDNAASPLPSDLLIRSGVVGSQLPKQFNVSSVSVNSGDVLILTTDGIRQDFIESVRTRENPQQQADRILTEFGIKNDDALVLVIRMHGMSDAADDQS